MTSNIQGPTEIPWIDRFLVDCQLLTSEHDRIHNAKYKNENIAELRIASVAMRVFGVWCGISAVFQALCMMPSAIATAVLAYDSVVVGDNIGKRIEPFNLENSFKGDVVKKADILRKKIPGNDFLTAIGRDTITMGVMREVSRFCESAGK